MTATLTPVLVTLADTVLGLLGINADTRHTVKIDINGWDNAWCEETSAPAAVEVAWSTWDEDDADWAWTDRTLAADVAGPYINALAASDRTNPTEPIEITVSHHYLRYVHPGIAGLL